MAELGGTVEYLYWSTRRTGRFMEDNDLSVQPVTRTFTSPAFGWLPTFSRTTTSANGTRPQIAKAIEDALGQTAVAKFNAPGPIRYAKGTGKVVFGDFISATEQEDESPAVMFTVADHSRRHRDGVAVCLFGSMDNFPEVIRESGPRVEWGWSSSAARSVFKFLKSQGKEIEGYGFLDTPGDICYAALQIARDQGIYKASWECTYGLDRPWERAFTYGDARQAQWLAQIYLDMTRKDLEADGFDFPRWDEAIPYQRVLIGAPLWIRTPGPQAITLYAGREDLDHPTRNPARSLLPMRFIMRKFTVLLQSRPPVR
jgi:hypothetical protein